jgi:hypothetical protein
VNDPTTAVQALDHIGALLVQVSGRELGVAENRADMASPQVKRRRRGNLIGARRFNLGRLHAQLFSHK